MLNGEILAGCVGQDGSHWFSIRNSRRWWNSFQTIKKIKSLLNWKNIQMANCLRKPAKPPQDCAFTVGFF
ncbi:hypothetical protein I7I48_10708 [Histoplasma ohiense]|nr:hypothetical protein I7I48_10708 [Histoplasma ohiense (nom. inval.)]